MAIQKTLMKMKEQKDQEKAALIQKASVKQTSKKLQDQNLNQVKTKDLADVQDNQQDETLDASQQAAKSLLESKL